MLTSQRALPDSIFPRNGIWHQQAVTAWVTFFLLHIPNSVVCSWKFQTVLDAADPLESLRTGVYSRASRIFRLGSQLTSAVQHLAGAHWFLTARQRHWASRAGTTHGRLPASLSTPLLRQVLPIARVNYGIHFPPEVFGKYTLT